MGYSAAAASIAKVSPYLEEIEKAGGKEIMFQSQTPWRLAYLLHQGFNGAKEIDHPKWGHFRDVYKIVKGVESVTVKRIVESVNVLSTHSGRIPTTGSEANVPKSDYQEITDKHGLLAILSVISSAPGNLEIRTEVSGALKEKLERFGEKNKESFSLDIQPDRILVTRLGGNE